MTPKVAFDNILRRIAQWSSPSKAQSHSRRAYRTEFQRFLWGAIFLTVYFLLVFYRLSGDDSGSSDNGGILAVIMFGVVFAALGAYFAPGWSSLANKYTASGKRRAAGKAAHIRKHPSGRSSSRPLESDQRVKESNSETFSKEGLNSNSPKETLGNGPNTHDF